MAKRIAPTPAMAMELCWPHLGVLGLDPSMTSTGWSITLFKPFAHPRVLSYGNITTTPLPGKLNQEQVVIRSAEIFTKLREVTFPLSFTQVSIEMPVPGSFGVASQSGAIMVAACQAAVLADHPNTPFVRYHPNSTKKAVTGDGRATKAEVKKAVFEWLDISFRTNTDVTDSIAAAITYALGART